MNDTTSPSGRRLSDADVLRAVPPLAGAREFRVGIFVILGVTAFLAVLYLMTSPALFRGRYMVTTHVPNAQGIRGGDPVRMRGINIGRVYGFALAPDGGVHLTLEIEGEYQIPAPARAELSAEGVLGGMVVAVIPGPGPETVAPGSLIPGESIAGVFEAAGGMAENAADVVDRIRALLADSTITNAGESISVLRDLLVEFQAIADGQAEGLRDLTATLGRAAANVEGITESDDWATVLASTRTTLATLERTTATTEAAIGSLNAILDRLARGEGTLGQLLTSDALYHNLDATVISLNELLIDLRENPDRYVRIEIF